MISQSQNRVKAIKSKFENLGTETPSIVKKHSLNNTQLCKQVKTDDPIKNVAENSNNKENKHTENDAGTFLSPVPNMSQLYKCGAKGSDSKKIVGDTKKSLSRQSSDPGTKKLHRSHAFRCDRSQKIVSPKRHGSCYGRSETSDFTLKNDKKLSKDRLKRLGNLLEDQMRKENFVVPSENFVVASEDFVVASEDFVVSSDTDDKTENELFINDNVEQVTEMDLNTEFQDANREFMDKDSFILNPDSVPDSEVPQHILEQYAKVIKPKKKETTDGMTDSGVSSETENLEDEKSGRIKKLMSQFEKTDNNLETINNLTVSSETMRLERKNPHLVLTDTLKKALKQPLPSGPPPKKPPRTFTAMAEIAESPEKQKKDAKQMLAKLEQVLQKREAQNQTLKPQSNEIETVSHTVPRKPKEIHYLCTEILDITQRTLLPAQLSNNCFKSLNCAITNNSTLSLPYTRFNTSQSNGNSNSLMKINDKFNNRCCSCSNNSLNETRRLSTFLTDYRCDKCKVNEENNGFKCHLNCKCKSENCAFYVENEHIYDEPCVDVVDSGRRNSDLVRRSVYGTLNHSKSMDDIRSTSFQEDQKIYDIPCELSRPATPEAEVLEEERKEVSREDVKVISTRASFEKLRSSFESASLSSIGRKSSKDSDKSILSTDSNDCKEKSDNKPKLKNHDIKKDDKNHDGSKTVNESDLEPDGGKITTTDDLITKEASNKRFGLTNTKDLHSRRIEKNNEKVGELNVKEDVNRKPEKPPMKPKPVLNRLSRSIDNIAEEKTGEKRFATEKRFQKRREVRLSLQKKDNSQLDVDRENLNRLMNEIYETVTQACNMENKPGSFPTDQSDVASEESVKLTRSLTEKRKNYVRRVSSKVAYLDQKNIKNTRFRHQTSICSYKSEILDPNSNPYSTFRSWKSFRASQNNLSKENKMADRQSIDSKANLTDSKGNLLKSDFDSFDSSLSIDDDLSVHEKTGCVDLELPFERQNGLFDVCLVVGLNYMTGQAYVRSVFPEQVQLPPHIENLIFPETLSGMQSGEWQAEAGAAHCYSLVLTDERGERRYGYCRRVLPEGATICLPLCYCLISKFREPGFYYKVLQEIESHHGSSESEIQSILQQLFDSDFPRPGEEITVSHNSNNYVTDSELNSSRNSINLGELLKSKTLPDMRYRRQISSKSDKTEFEHGNSKIEQQNSKIEQQNSKTEQRNSKLEQRISKFESDKSDMVSNKSDSSDVPCDVDNNNEPIKVMLTLDGMRIKSMKRPIEPRSQWCCMRSIVEWCGASLTVNMFASLLLERKLFIVGDRLSQISSCLEALQLALYPFVWQQPLISTVPSEIQRDVLDAPLPILGGALGAAGASYWRASGTSQDTGMLIDLTHPSKVLVYQGDESTILPTPSYKTLKTTLRMEIRNKEDTSMKNVMISEAFLRFFVDILGDFWRYFSYGEMKDGALGKGGVVFDREAFIKNTPSKQNQYFLEWFTETAMFNHFIQNMSVEYHNRQTNLNPSLNLNTSSNDVEFKQVDTPLPNFYDLFLDRIKSRTKVEVKNIDSKNNYKNAVNKRVRLLKNKLRELVA